MAKRPPSHGSGMTSLTRADAGVPAFAPNHLLERRNSERVAVSSFASSFGESASSSVWTRAWARAARDSSPALATSVLLRLFRRHQPKPQEIVRTHRQQIRPFTNGWKGVLAVQLQRYHAVKLAKIQ